MPRQHRLALPALVVVVGLVGLVALTGTAGAAALVTGRQVKDGSVTGRDVMNAAVTGRDVRDGALGQADVEESLAGPAGPAGPAGAPGAVGPAGAAGAVGPTGQAGQPGPRGPLGPQGPRGMDGVNGWIRATGAAWEVTPGASITFALNCSVYGDRYAFSGGISTGGDPRSVQITRSAPSADLRGWTFGVRNVGSATIYVAGRTTCSYFE